MAVLAHLGVPGPLRSEVSLQGLLDDFAAGDPGDVADFITGQNMSRSRSSRKATSPAPGGRGVVYSMD